MVRTPFRLVQEDRFAPLAAIHDVENRTVILDSQLAGRDARMTHPASCINIKSTPLYFIILDNVILDNGGLKFRMGPI